MPKNKPEIVTVPNEQLKLFKELNVNLSAFISKYKEEAKRLSTYYTEIENYNNIYNKLVD